MYAESAIAWLSQGAAQRLKVKRKVGRQELQAPHRQIEIIEAAEIESG